MSLQFDSAYYLAQNPDVAEAINSGQVSGAKWHFDNFGAAEGRDPNATFDVSYYLEQNTDVAEAFESGAISNPFEHFLEYGAGEGRAPNANLAAVAAGFDEEAYLSANEDVADAVDNGVFDSGYQHWVVYGQYEEDRPEATYNDGTPVSDVTAVTALTEGLETLQGAQEAQADYLDGLELDTDFDGEVDVEAGDAVESDVTDALGNARDAVNDATDDAVGDISSDRSDAYNQAIIDEQKSVNNTALSEAQENVDAVDGLQANIDQLESAQADFRDAFQANAEATTELNGELAKANEVNDTTSWSNGLTGDLQVVGDLSAVTTEGDPVVTDSATAPASDVIVLGANGQLEAAENLDTSAIDGFDALLEDSQAAYDAQLGLTSATGSFEDAIEGVIEAEDGTVGAVGDYYDDGTTTPEDAGNLTTDLTDADTGAAPLTGALLDAQETVETFNQAVENYTSANDTAGQLETLNANIEDARDAIQNDEDDGGLGVALTEGTNENADGNDNVFLFSDDEGASHSIANFGAEGQDRIYFGDDFELTALGDDEEITDRVGSADQKEIFWQEDDSGLNLFVEAEAEAGRDTGTAATANMTEISLTGVDADDVNFGSGYLTAGEVA